MTNEERIPTTQRLAEALREAKAPISMIRAAKEGWYDVFGSQSSTPTLDLVHECDMLGLIDLSRRVRAGEFAPAPWEQQEERAITIDVENMMRGVQLTRRLANIARIVLRNTPDNEMPSEWLRLRQQAEAELPPLPEE